MLKKQSICLILLLFLTGCGGQAYEYQDTKEMKPGPGVLSGADGEFNLLHSQQESGDDAKKERSTTPTTGKTE